MMDQVNPEIGIELKTFQLRAACSAAGPPVRWDKRMNCGKQKHLREAFRILKVFWETCLVKRVYLKLKPSGTASATVALEAQP